MEFAMENNQVENSITNWDHNANGSSNAAFKRLVSKFGEIATPKTIRNLQNINLSLEFPAEPLKSPTQAIYSLCEQIEFLNSTSSIDENEDAINSQILAESIEKELREAKVQDVASGSGEMIIPAELSARVAADVIRIADDEPCGLKGCVIYINYEEKSTAAVAADHNNRRLGKVRCDPASVPTFEVTLTLKQDSSWALLFPLKGAWKKLKSKALIISSTYTITKNKLYRTSQQ